MFLSIFLFFSSFAHARGGGGCLAAGTLVQTSHGPVPIETITENDFVLANNSDGTKVYSKVLAKLSYEVNEVVEIHTQHQVIVSSLEHPFFLDESTLKVAGSLKPGDHLGTEVISKIILRNQKTSVFNLLTEPPNSFIANKLQVHNKGCFLPQTPVLLSDGTSKPISEVASGDKVTAFDHDGNKVIAQVNQIIRAQEDHYYVIKTTEGSSVSATAEHPFYIGQGIFKLVKALKVGDQVFVFKNQMRLETISSIVRTSTDVQVYNLQTDYPNTFIANGFAVHNKGGGGGGRGGRSYVYYRGNRYSSCSAIPDQEGRDDCTKKDWFWFFVICGFFVLLTNFTSKNSGLDEMLSDSEIANKADRTETLIKEISKADAKYELNEILKVVEHAFRTLQSCWENRNYLQMEPLVYPYLKKLHVSQIEAMISANEINRIEGLRIEKIRLIHLVYIPRSHHDQFTALIQAKAQDYYVHDATGTVIRGDEEPKSFQEYWTFQFLNGRWLLREIEQIGDSNLIDGLNVNESTLAITSAPKPSSTKNKVSSLIEQYHFADPIWEEQSMKQLARGSSLSVLLALESGQISNIDPNRITARMKNTLEQEIAKQKTDHKSIFYRNLCCRGVEIIYAKDFPAEFTVRASMHAQKTVHQNGSVITSDLDVTPFSVSLQFVKEGETFKLDKFII